ncbi:uncharacterized protein EI90DRAFT_3044670 [Cantharellus anzutake]|uniref:uncharacterized protein n=1 Tax=Cantharellus anzutake TaxID=1750568 RepID=UPI0019053E9F|nr:uncharacterized protein EI90DRAFT_3044670 [Cantharellus anzutake]KAF8337041.1 hypothetical protein EI90DRAFT_3044670 [Cantharellus anzutake]
MVDQLGKEIITVPMYLRLWDSQGFPDRTLRNWLLFSETTDWQTVHNRLCGFAYSLLVVTLRELKIISEKQDIPELPRHDEESARKLCKEKPEDYVPLVIELQKRLASAFREHMTAGQSYYTSNSNREIFYHKFVENSGQVDHENMPEHGQYGCESWNLVEAGERLCRFIDEHKVLESHQGPRRPLVILALDEAHVLTDNLPEQRRDLFMVLRQYLRQLQMLPIFWLFISTAACFDKWPPRNLPDPSARVREPDNRPLDLISEISFDDIA